MPDPTPPQQGDLLRILAGHSDVHLHRQPDGTVTVTAVREPNDDDLASGLPLWVDVEAGAS